MHLLCYVLSRTYFLFFSFSFFCLILISYSSCLAMIRNFHVHYVPHPTFQDQEVLQALIVHLSRVRCLFEKKNTKVQVKVYAFEIPMNNVVIRFVWFWEHLLFCLPFWCWYHLKRVVDYNSLIQPSKFCIGKMMLY